MAEPQTEIARRDRELADYLAEMESAGGGIYTPDFLSGFRHGLDMIRAYEVEGRVEAACEVMHDAYEAAAVGAGWQTQQASRKPWAEVPEANKTTMRAAVRALLAWQSDQSNPPAQLPGGRDE